MSNLTPTCMNYIDASHCQLWLQPKRSSSWCVGAVNMQVQEWPALLIIHDKVRPTFLRSFSVGKFDTCVSRMTNSLNPYLIPNQAALKSWMG